jgi:hypothetical protein
VTPTSLKKIKQELRQTLRSPQGRKPDELVSFAKRLGREKDSRGKEPTYVREREPALGSPLSIPRHGSKELKPCTTKNIITTLLDDADKWEQFLNSEDEDEDD